MGEQGERDPELEQIFARSMRTSFQEFNESFLATVDPAKKVDELKEGAVAKLREAVATALEEDGAVISMFMAHLEGELGSQKEEAQRAAMLKQDWLHSVQASQRESEKKKKSEWVRQEFERVGEQLRHFLRAK